MERAYGSLAPERRDLLSKISCFRGSMEYAVLKNAFPSADLDKALLDLRKRGLLQYAGESQRYDMHPIVRHYAYDHFTDEKRRKEAHVELAKHFSDDIPAANTKVKTLEDLAPVIELYYHMVRAGQFDEAYNLFDERLNSPLFYQFGAYQIFIELQSVLFDEKTNIPRVKKERQVHILNDIAGSYAYCGQPHRAILLVEQAIKFLEPQGNKQNLATGLGNMATQQLVIGALSAAEHNLRRRIDLCREIGNERSDAIGHQELGRVLSYRGAWWEAEQELDTGLKLFEKEHDVQSECVIWSYRALRFLFTARGELISNHLSVTSVKSAIECAQHALELADETTRTKQPYPRDYIHVYWLLGAAYRMNNDLTLAEENLSKALNLCRKINMVDHEADILLDLARLRYAQGDFKDAQEKASEALMITERSEYVLQGADVNLFLAELALKGYKSGGLSDKDVAMLHAKEALKLATCDGPPYYYKVAYEEAERMLEKLK